MKGSVSVPGETEPPGAESLSIPPVHTATVRKAGM